MKKLIFVLSLFFLNFSFVFAQDNFDKNLENQDYYKVTWLIDADDVESTDKSWWEKTESDYENSNMIESETEESTNNNFQSEENDLYNEYDEYNSFEDKSDDNNNVDYSNSIQDEPDVNQEIQKEQSQDVNNKIKRWIKGFDSETGKPIFKF